MAEGQKQSKPPDGGLKMTVLQTVKLTLSPCCPSDRADFMDLERDREVMRFLNGGFAVDPEQSDPDSTFLMPRGTETYVWTARRRSDSAFVGWFCLWPESNSVAELGYRLRRSEWGQGHATEGALALVNWGFESCRYDRIFASTMAVNHASRRVLDKIGLTYTHTIYVDWAAAIPGGENGEVQYEVKRLDWNAI
jgi:RimJ/RimL family protein N-acetyltransferase